MVVLIFHFHPETFRKMFFSTGLGTTTLVGEREIQTENVKVNKLALKMVCLIRNSFVNAILEHLPCSQLKIALPSWNSIWCYTFE